MIIAVATSEFDVDQERALAARFSPPVRGTVHELIAPAVGGIVAPGETVTKIVPQADRRLPAVRLGPTASIRVLSAPPLISVKDGSAATVHKRCKCRW